ncbi:hypothetical protein STANM309S_00813 [Streptomyces tanashiensis]
MPTHSASSRSHDAAISTAAPTSTYHTSHLFAVHPGRQITTKSPAFSAAALVSLKARCGEKEGIPFAAATVSGDRRRSWTWPWRATPALGTNGTVSIGR